MSDMQDQSIDQELAEYLNTNTEKVDRAHEIMEACFFRLKEAGIPTIIMFKEVERLSQFLAIDFSDGYGDEAEATDILGAAVGMNQKEVETETFGERVKSSDKNHETGDRR